MRGDVLDAHVLVGESKTDLEKYSVTDSDTDSEIDFDEELSPDEIRRDLNEPSYFV